ncbi:unnamed protein product, partial [Staurois parvus]
TCATLQCHTPVPRSATYLCPAVPPTCATHQCCHQCRLSVPIISVTYQCRLSVLHISAAYPCTSLVLPISAAYPCHLISTAYQCPSVPPISAHQCCLINAHQ